jgi:tryptophan-rich sensory protein
VWTTLYVMMAVAAWSVWLEGPAARPALNLFFIQLALNFAWSFLFFGWQRPGWALVEIVVLWVFVALTMRAFFKLRPAAGTMMVPYLAWISFASYLNAGIWWLN